MGKRLRAFNAQVVASAVLVLLSALWAAPASAHGCDRVCLADTISAYVDALVAHDPSALPLAPGARFTENSTELMLGDGLWKTVTGKASFRQDYLDTTRQIAAAQVELREGNISVLYVVVLQMQDRKIAGIETMVQRVEPDLRSQHQQSELAGREPQLDAPIRGMNDPVPSAMKQPRASLIATALSYADGLRIGNFNDSGAPLAPAALRVENGVITAGQGCVREPCNMYAQRTSLHPALVPSVAAVDEDNGTVLLWMNFGDTGAHGAGKALVTLEGFKIWGGQIRAINAFFCFLPAATARFWKSSDPVPR